MSGDRRFSASTDASIAVEFALLLPVMAALLFGSFTANRLVRANIKLWNAGQSIADLVAQQTTVTAAKLRDYCTGASLTMAPFSGSITATVASVTYSTSSRAVDWQDTSSCGTSSAMSDALTRGTVYTPTTGDSVIIVRVTYTYNFPASYILPASTTFTRYIYSRPRSGSKVAYG